SEGELSLTITDDGMGIASEVTNSGDGLGVQGMRERAERIGGRLEISSRPEKGTNVQFTMELP
ncbi:MAG: ATP-binding protein, partial [Chloroflexota bacterium]|nr:ATP-binding protein [Chloroflexota bacterium]